MGSGTLIFCKKGYILKLKGGGGALGGEGETGVRFRFLDIVLLYKVFYSLKFRIGYTSSNLNNSIQNQT
tara:strand:- start:8381 stop:8587 length:207 start_codon:yes stop_codon:yes gene_type:complete